LEDDTVGDSDASVRASLCKVDLPVRGLLEGLLDFRLLRRRRKPALVQAKTAAPMSTAKSGNAYLAPRPQCARPLVVATSAKRFSNQQSGASLK
jgi:hypothetical protein